MIVITPTLGVIARNKHIVAMRRTLSSDKWLAVIINIIVMTNITQQPLQKH